MMDMHAMKDRFWSFFYTVLANVLALILYSAIAYAFIWFIW